jgi:hypothetical protein
MDPHPPLPDPESRALPSGSTPPESATQDALQKQVRELQSRFDDHQRRSALESSRLWDHHLHLRKLCLGALVVLILLNAGIFPFFVKQMKLVRAQLPNQRLANFQIAGNLAKHDAALRKFAAQLQAFAKAHPDFRPILDKYHARLPHYFTRIVPAMPVAAPLPGLPVDPVP